MILELAVAARAERIVTHNLGHFGAAVRSFGIEAVTPAAILAESRRKR